MVRVPCKIALHIANLHSNGYFSLCGIIIPPDKTVYFFPVLSRGIISDISKIMLDRMDYAGEKTGNPGNETEQSENGTENDSCIQQK